MTYVPYDNFMPGVLPFCPGVPEVVAYDAVRNAAIELLEKSHWLLYTPDPISGIANVAQYQFDCPSSTYIARVQNAWWDTYRMEPKTDDQMRDLFGIDWRTVQGTPRYYTQTDDITQLVVVPFPLIAEVNSLTGLVALMPTRASTTIDPTVFQRWYEVINHGALARLMSMPAQAFTNQALSARHDLAFKSGISEAKIERNRGNQRTEMVMRPPRFF